MLDRYVSLMMNLGVSVSFEQKGIKRIYHACWNPPSGSSSCPSPVPQYRGLSSALTPTPSESSSIASPSSVSVSAPVLPVVAAPPEEEDGSGLHNAVRVRYG